ncbi:uncharacterized protein LOC108824830 [Raphanus sativus]|uniref:Uncharacterized protein LOC108824830 n=1 Tax=Raphanus sativus TaxID=3726 RepID=A0A9W3CGQ5_RAPSA|nr:uncharacterized protein LOC108824830 [Raphanus sativus]
MASLNKPGSLTGAEYEAIQELWGVPYEAVIDYPNGDTPGNVRPVYCGAFMCFFRDGLMSFPIPSFLLEILAELGLAFTQITPTFWRYVLTTFVRAREEGLKFGLAELKQLYTLKRSSGVTGAILLSPQAGRSIISDIPGKDVYWTDKFFVFKIDPVTVGDFDFSRIPMKWNENVGMKRKEPHTEPSDANSDFAPLKRARGTPDKRVLRSSSQVQSLVVVATPLSVVPPARGDRPEARVPGEVEAGEVVSKVQRRRLTLEEEVSRDLSVSSSEPQKQDPGEGTTKPINFPTDCRTDSPLAFSYDVDTLILENPEQLAAIWRKLRRHSCELPSLEHMRGPDAYVQMAVANAKAMEASNEYAALMEERLANFPTGEELGGQLTMIQHLRSKLTKGYDAALDTVRGTIRRRKAESAAEMRLQEVRAKIKALTEYMEGGFELEEELDRLKRRDVEGD